MYPFSYAHGSGKGNYRFTYGCFSEIYYEIPQVIIWFPNRWLVKEADYLQFMLWFRFLEFDKTKILENELKYFNKNSTYIFENINKTKCIFSNSAYSLESMTKIKDIFCTQIALLCKNNKSFNLLKSFILEHETEKNGIKELKSCLLEAYEIKKVDFISEKELTKDEDEISDISTEKGYNSKDVKEFLCSALDTVYEKDRSEAISYINRLYDRYISSEADKTKEYSIEAKEFSKIDIEKEKYFYKYAFNEITEDILNLTAEKNIKTIIKEINNKFSLKIFREAFFYVNYKFLMRTVNLSFKNIENILRRVDTKDIDVSKITSYVEKAFKDAIDYFCLFKFEKDSKESVNFYNELQSQKWFKNAKRDVIENLIHMKSPKEIKNFIIYKFLEMIFEDEIFKEIIENNFNIKTPKNITTDDDYDNTLFNQREAKNAELHIDTDKFSDKGELEFFCNIIKNASKYQKEINIEKIKELLKDNKDIDVFKALILSRKEIDIDILKTFLTSYEEKLIYVQNEHNLKLWQRFWFLYAGDIFDDKIIPSCCDYPYSEEPIVFDGFDDLMPENWQVVYPEEFWKIIDHHPIELGKGGMGIDEIPLAINIMVEIINIFILMWNKFYSAFWGWTGTQAVIGITYSIFEWLTLETSEIALTFDKGSKKHYERCYRWLRWEAEKMALMARNDMELKGNYYVGLLLEEMINYMLDHHFDVMPIFTDVNKMDEWRRLFDRDLQNDIQWVLDKVKGIRHKTIVGKERKENV